MIINVFVIDVGTGVFTDLNPDMAYGGPLSSTHNPASSKEFSPIHSCPGKLPDIKGEAGVMLPFGGLTSNKPASDRQMYLDMLNFAKKQLENLEKHDKVQESNENMTESQSISSEETPLVARSDDDSTLSRREQLLAEKLSILRSSEQKLNQELSELRNKKECDLDLRRSKGRGEQTNVNPAGNSKQYSYDARYSNNPSRDISDTGSIKQSKEREDQSYKLPESCQRPLNHDATTSHDSPRQDHEGGTVRETPIQDQDDEPGNATPGRDQDIWDHYQVDDFGIIIPCSVPNILNCDR